MTSSFATVRAAGRFAGVLRQLGHRPTLKIVRGEWVVGVVS